MAQRARASNGRAITPRSGSFGTAAGTARQQFAWLWSRESLLRLGLAFVLATALWLYVTNKQDPTQAWDFPAPLTVNPENVPQGLIVSNNLPQVHVRVQANRNTTPVTQTSFHTFVDLNGYRRGLHEVNIAVAPDPGIQVLQISPSSIPVFLDLAKQQTVPVRAHYFGRPPAGYTAGEIIASPDTVEVSGPAAAVSQVTQVLVYIDLTGARTPIGGVYPLSPANSRGVSVPAHNLTVQPAQVHITVPVSSPSTYRTLPVIAAPTGQPRAGLGVLNVSASPSNITVYGSPGQLSSVSSLLTAAISVAHRGAGTFRQSVKILLPRGLRANAYSVTVKVQIGPVASSNAADLGVVPLNLSSGLAVQVRPSRVLVTAAGPPDIFRTAVTRSRPVVDLAGLAAGTYQLQPMITLPGALKLVGLFPSQVTVVLTPAR